MRKYSRLINIQEKRHRRAAFFWMFLTIVFIIAFLFWGLPVLANISSFILDVRFGKPTAQQDKTAPASPLFITQPTATNSAKLVITGTAEAKSTVILSHNGQEQQLAVDDQSHFETVVTLLEGENIFVASTKDEAGNNSPTSKKLVITLDTTPPEVTIQQPQPSTKTDQETITVSGSVSEEATVWINNKITAIRDDNTFSATVLLNEGTNTITIKAQDQAGNSGETTLTVNRLS